MNNLDKIIKPWAMGWSAILDTGEGSGHVVAIDNNNGVIVFWNDDYAEIEPKYGIEKCKISGYLYAGELAGNEPIPKGQKFRVKHNDLIATYKGKVDDTGTILVRYEDGYEDHYPPKMIEPYFE